MMIALIVFAILLACYAAVLWMTREGGPCDASAFWDEEDGR